MCDCLCVQAAAAAWRNAREAGVEPDLILYSAMIDACAKVPGKPWGACLEQCWGRKGWALLAGQPACSLSTPLTSHSETVPPRITPCSVATLLLPCVFSWK